MRILVCAAVFLSAFAPLSARACTADPATQTAYPNSVVIDTQTRGAVTRAWLDAPVTRYAHFVLGRRHEPSALWVNAPGNRGLCGHVVILDDAHVFEDIAPRLADLDGDGTNEVVVVRSNLDLGAQLAVYRWSHGELILEATTPYIGRPHRWLAPVGIADLDGDGSIEIAFVDRPHLRRALRIYRYAPGNLTEIATINGLTNHRIGDSGVVGGVRYCDDGPELVLPSQDWRVLQVIRLSDESLTIESLGNYDPQDLEIALNCGL